MNSAREAQLIEKIRNGSLSEKELINLYKNAATRNAIAVMQAVQTRMRVDFPRAATREFGAKESEANALLEEAFRDIATTFDLSGNRHKNGVKAGGQKLSGKKHIDVYISYKNGEDIVAFLCLIQDDPESELTARAGRYKAGDHNSRDEKLFKMDDFKHAVDAFKDELSKVLSGG